MNIIWTTHPLSRIQWWVKTGHYLGRLNHAWFTKVLQFISAQSFLFVTTNWDHFLVVYLINRKHLMVFWLKGRTQYWAFLSKSLIVLVLSWQASTWEHPDFYGPLNSVHFMILILKGYTIGYSSHFFNKKRHQVCEKYLLNKEYQCIIKCEDSKLLHLQWHASNTL